MVIGAVGSIGDCLLWFLSIEVARLTVGSVGPFVPHMCHSEWGVGVTKGEQRGVAHLF